MIFFYLLQSFLTSKQNPHSKLHFTESQKKLEYQHEEFDFITAN